MISPRYDHTDIPQLNNFRFNPSTIVPTYGAGGAGRAGRAGYVELVLIR